ncbi:hypothetical protein SteCoe_26796 [Stentor coeruleus]|uniref:Centrosomal protein of 70 kDa n=1 Tax=Stentor coeruleus TaxID=5963 RepID=A0A1R2BC03_9CILI|nr:hypothetical protein SteCoe_26796 [Stentor coeruleus]
MSDLLSSYLDFDSEPEIKVSRAQLLENFEYLQNTLIAQGLPTPGNLFNNDLKEIKKSIDCIYSLLQQRQKDLNFRSQVQDIIAKLESEKTMYKHKIEQLNEDKSFSNSEAGKAQNKLTQELAKFKKEKEKITSENNDLRKEITKMVSKETKLYHEIKKKDTVFEKNKEQLRKALGDKDLLYQNHIDLVQPLHASGPKLIANKAEEEFSYLITKGYDDNQNYLLNENQELRSALETIQKELHLLIEERKEQILQNKSRIPNISLIQINSQIFSAPFQSVSEDLIDTFIENIKRFKQFMQLTSAII